jgi:uncharacterized membrane-anchored protein YhcB (DUF1043 family)
MEVSPWMLNGLVAGVLVGMLIAALLASRRRRQ